MWRNVVRVGNNAQENHDSDQSISEEEEGLDNEWTGKTISLSRGENKKGKMQVLSQLEILRESCELHSTEESITSHVKKGGYHIEDEVEIPMFNDGDCPSHHHRAAAATHARSNDGMIYLPAVASISYSDEELISDDEKINPPAIRSAIENLGGTWSQAGHEVEALARSSEKASCSSHHDVFLNEKKSSRGGGGRKKAKPRFSFPLHSHKKDPSSVVSDSNGRTLSDNIPVADEIGAASHDDLDNDMAESQLHFHDKETEQPGNHTVPFELAHKHDTKGHSMAEFLNCFLERSDHRESSEVEIQKKRRVHKMSKRNTSPLGDVIVDDDDLLEALDSGSPSQSEDDEENAQIVKSSIPRTMVDQFHEAFGTASLIDDRLHVAFPRPLCSELYTKLQQVMQSEKERDMYSLKTASAETGLKDEGMSILVRILSRSLEAKLIVCSCTSVGNGQNLYWENNLETKMKGIPRTLTIIFNPRMCSDVDLEVGNLICVRPPWKEVQVKDEVIYLCSYFVQVQP